MTLHATPRFNLYTTIHKAMRAYMAETLCRLGRLDVNDPADMAATLAELEALLENCAAHLRHENDFLHTAMEARLPSSATTTASDHREHVECIERLRAMSARLAATPIDAPADGREAQALALYQEVALFIADNLQHMHVEETINNGALWAAYSDAELVEIHDRLLMSLTPQEHMQAARWMLPASNPSERHAMLSDMKGKLPPPAFQGVLALVKPHIDDIGWAKLATLTGTFTGTASSEMHASREAEAALA